MSRPTAKQIVASLLEYGIDPDAPRPGSPDDPWRQSYGPLPPMEFGGRPGPAEDAPETPQQVPINKKPKQRPFSDKFKHSKGSRFNWKPPVEPPPQA